MLDRQTKPHHKDANRHTNKRKSQLKILKSEREREKQKKKKRQTMTTFGQNKQQTILICTVKNIGIIKRTIFRL